MILLYMKLQQIAIDHIDFSDFHDIPTEILGKKSIQIQVSAISQQYAQKADTKFVPEYDFPKNRLQSTGIYYIISMYIFLDRKEFKS